MSEGNLIDAVCDRIKFDKERLEKNDLGRIEVESFNLSEFWTQFGAAVQSLNNEVTKVGFTCGKKPFPTGSEIDSMMQDLLQYYTIMRDLYLVLPPDVGAVLYKAVTSAMVAIMASLLDFVKSLHNLTEKGAKERLSLTGTFWDACNAVDALPKDNLQATLKVMEGEVDLASDAQQELETVVQGKIKPGKSEFQVNDVRTDSCNPTKLEKIFRKNDFFDTVSGNKKNQDNISQLNGKPLRAEQCVLKGNQCNENTKASGEYKPRLIILTGTDFKNLEKWISSQLCCGKSPSAEVMQSKINEITQLVQKLETNPNDPFFEGMTESQKKEKYTNLNKTLEDFLAMKKIIDTEPEQFKKMISKVNLNSSSDEINNQIPKAENYPKKVLNSVNHRCKNELDSAVTSDKSSSVDERFHEIEVAGKCPKTRGTNTIQISSPPQDIVSQQKPPVSNLMKPTQGNSRGMAETREWIASQKRLGNHATFSELMQDINLCSNMIKTHSATWKDQSRYKTTISTYNKKLKQLLLVKQTMEENTLLGLGVENNSVPSGVQLQNDFNSGENNAVDQHVSKGEEQLRTVPVNSTQIQGPNPYNRSVNISVKLDYSSSSSTSNRCSSEISGNKRKINLGISKEGPFKKNSRAEFCSGNQTNVNLSICSSVGVTSQQVKSGCDIRTDAKLTVSLSDVHETKLSQAVGSPVQVTTNTLPVSRQNSDMMKNPYSNLDNAAVRTTGARMTKHYQDFMKSLETATQAPTVHNSDVKPLRNPYQLPLGIGVLSENSSLEVHNHVNNVKGVDFVKTNNKFVQAENSDMSKTKYGQDVELFTSVQKPDRKFQELIHMFMPTPTAHNCSTAFLYYYPHLQIREALENIARRNPRLNCKEWTVHREWWDEHHCYNALLWTDTDSLRELEAQGLTARVTYRYYAFFRRASMESNERLMPNISQPLLMNSQCITSTVTPMLVSDYQHGMSYNFPTYHEPSVSITQSVTAQVSSSFTPVRVTDYQHGLSVPPSTEPQRDSEKSLIYSPTQPTSDSSDEDSSQPTTQTYQVTSPGVITDYTEIFF